MPIKTRRPTGIPPWPILLLAGVPKAGKSYASAAASASDLIGRTLWITIGEDEPDELGEIPGADFEIVEHDGTYRGIVQAVHDAVDELRGDTKPGLIVIDSMTALWGLLSDEAQVTANQRRSRRAGGSDNEAQITMDLWNVAKKRWYAVVDLLRAHQGPVLLTARLEQVLVMDDRGQPTKDRTWKVQAHKSLPWDVGGIVEMPAPGVAMLTGCRSLRMPVPDGEKRPLPDFTVDGLWRAMGLDDGASKRTHTSVDSDASVAADHAAAADPKRRAVMDAVYAEWTRLELGDGDALSAAVQRRLGVPASAATTEQFEMFLTELKEKP